MPQDSMALPTERDIRLVNACDDEIDVTLNLK